MDYTYLNELFERWLLRTGLPTQQVAWLGLLLGIVVVFTLMALFSKLLNYVLTSSLHRFAQRTGSQFDDNLVSYRVPRYLARVIPLVLSYQLIPVVLIEHPSLISLTEKLFMVFFIVLVVRILRAFMRAGRDTLRETEAYKDKPLQSYLQIASLVLYFIAGILIFSQLTGRSIVAFLTAMGAASAVLLLVFKDAILGFVASIQISANDMVRLGDWITISKYGADGDVTEINLTTVKVMNFDKTITTVPTYALITDSFQNWRGMVDSGGRRVKRSLLIKISSVRFLSAREIEELERIQLIEPYIQERRAEILAYNQERHVDPSMLVNGRNMTNVGLFRRYVDIYLSKHPRINQHMTRMVRHLQPNEHGLPMEIYCFTDTTEWAAYEGIMSDIFDHLLSAAPYFHLAIFEHPAADDVRSLGALKKTSEA